MNEVEATDFGSNIGAPLTDPANCHLSRTWSMPPNKEARTSGRNRREDHDICSFLPIRVLYELAFPVFGTPVANEKKRVSKLTQHEPGPMRATCLFLLFVLSATVAIEAHAQQRQPRMMRPQQFRTPGRVAPRMWGQNTNLIAQRSTSQFSRNRRILKHFRLHTMPRYSSPRSIQRAYQNRRAQPYVNTQLKLARRFRFVRTQLRTHRPQLRIIRPRQYN